MFMHDIAKVDQWLDYPEGARHHWDAVYLLALAYTILAPGSSCLPGAINEINPHKRKTRDGCAFLLGSSSLVCLASTNDSIKERRLQNIFRKVSCQYRTPQHPQASTTVRV